MTKSAAVSDGIIRSRQNFEMAIFLEERRKNRVNRSKNCRSKIYNDKRLNSSSENNQSIEENFDDNNFHDYFEQDIIEFQEDEEVYYFNNEKYMKDDTVEKKKESAIDLRIPSFNMKKLSKNLTLLSVKASFQQGDDGKKLLQGGKVRKGSFARAIHAWSLEYNLPSIALDSLINILNKSFKGYELPVKNLPHTKAEVKFHTLDEYKNRNRIEAQKLLDKDEDFFYKNDDSEAEYDSDLDEKTSLCTEDLMSNEVQASIRDYCKTSVRYVAVDQCECDNHVYAGSNNQFNCPVCNKLRFRACSRTLCDGNGEAKCEHLRSADGDGIAVKQLFFRPLLVLISDLLRTPNFLCSLRYERVEEIVSPHGVHIYSDVMDGDEVKFHLHDMKLRYNLWRHSKPERLNSEEVSLVLSEFYDGGQLFKSKTSNFWILMTQILNLPPTFRGKLGIGMFLSAIYSGKHLEAEKFLFTDMYCEELRLLYDGVDLVINSKRYYIQARLILHTLDSKALEAVLCLQSASMSLFGCALCGSCTGVHDGSKAVYIGHRQLLPLNSYLRYIGQSGKCCPPGFYDINRINVSTETFTNGLESFSLEDHESYKETRIIMQKKITQIQQQSATKYSNEHLELHIRPKVWKESIEPFYSENANALEYCQPCDGNKRRETAIKKFFFVNESINYYWSHQKPNLFEENIYNKAKGLRKVLIYRHFDLRPHKPYSRVTYKDHLESALIARDLNDNRKTQAKKHSNGIQDVWAFERLPYANVSHQVTWPFLHSICGVIKLLINTMLGTKDIKESIVKESFVVNNLEQNITDNDECTGDESIADEWEDEHIVETKVADVLTSSERKKQKQKQLRLVKETNFYAFRPKKTIKRGYVCTNPDRKRCREWLQCIILPAGLGEDSWDMRKFIINDQKLIPGYMKMNQRLKLISCFWDFIISAMSDIEDPHKVFYSMVGVNLRKLQSNYFTSDDIVQLSRDIEEMVSLWEAVFPLKLCTFIVHELIDLSPFIRHFGPPIGVSEFPGERAVGALINRKLKCNAGGCSFENYVMDRHIDFELRKIKQFYSNKYLNEPNAVCTFSPTTGKCIYDGERYNISKPESETSRKLHPPTKLTEYELDLLNDTLILEVQRLHGAENQEICSQKSIVYNLEIKRRIHNKGATVSNWLKHVVNNESHLFCVEEVNVANNLLSLNPEFFQKATIRGLSIRSRGSWKREKSMPKSQRYGSQSNLLKGSLCSELQNCFRDKINSSSWCIYRQSEYPKMYAQVNGFFQFHVGDESLDGLLIASVTSRHYTLTPKTNLVKISNKESLNLNSLFVSIKDIFPSRIATIPFINTVKAINTHKPFTFNSTYSTNNKNNELSFLIMITLHPERLTFRKEYN